MVRSVVGRPKHQTEETMKVRRGTVCRRTRLLGSNSLTRWNVRGDEEIAFYYDIISINHCLWIGVHNCNPDRTKENVIIWCCMVPYSFLDVTLGCQIETRWRWLYSVVYKPDEMRSRWRGTFPNFLVFRQECLLFGRYYDWSTRWIITRLFLNFFVQWVFVVKCVLRC